MTDAVHAHDALAGVELWVGGARAANLYSREMSLDVSSMPLIGGYPAQTRAMDRSDIRQLRRWHREAALRAKEAGFDIVYVYATHGYLLSHFLSPHTNSRTDEYGGSAENRTRLLRELIEETKEAVGDKCAVAVRYSVGSVKEDDPELANERRERLELLAELPDLWDINIDDYSQEMGVSRFFAEGSLEEHMSFVKSVTSKPVVTVGRFTSPDTMVSQVKRGVVDFIGAARPSIADPFLPRKIEQGRVEDIRECIGCNICYTGDGLGVPIRCTQNPTMSEEWRRGWHPEIIAERGSASRVLVVGAGPAGLEAARALGQRGYEVMLAEATRELGGRVTRECALPGLSEWARVRDYRVQQFAGMPNVEVFRESELGVEDVLAVEADHVVIATGSHWRADGFGHYHQRALTTLSPDACVLTPDDVMSGNIPSGATVIFDDDHYYMGGVLAERLARENRPVTLMTPAEAVSSWCGHTAEQALVQKRLLELGVTIKTFHVLLGFDGEQARVCTVHDDKEHSIDATAVLMVTARTPNDDLYQALQRRREDGMEGMPKTLRRIGDCDAPSIIAAAVHAGHRYARELDSNDALCRYE